MSSDTKSPEQIIHPTSGFKIEMLNPESWEINGHVGTMSRTVIGTDQWVEMQEKALTFLTGEARKVATQEAIEFWENVVIGIVPNGLRITRPDPLTRMR